MILHRLCLHCYARLPNLPPSALASFSPGFAVDSSPPACAFARQPRHFLFFFIDSCTTSTHCCDYFDRLRAGCARSRGPATSMIDLLRCRQALAADHYLLSDTPTLSTWIKSAASSSRYVWYIVQGQVQPRVSALCPRPPSQQVQAARLDARSALSLARSPLSAVCCFLNSCAPKNHFVCEVSRQERFFGCSWSPHPLPPLHPLQKLLCPT